MELLPVLILPMLLTIAAVSDMTTMTIPNWISGLLILAFLTLSITFGMSPGQIGLSFGVGFAVLILGMILFALGWLGGGDAKLLAATSLWFGWSAVFPFLVYTMLVGGVLSLVMINFRRLSLPPRALAVPWVVRMHKIDEGLPYGIAIAIGGLAALSQVPLLPLLGG